MKFSVAKKKENKNTLYQMNEKILHGISKMMDAILCVNIDKANKRPLIFCTVLNILVIAFMIIWFLTFGLGDLFPMLTLLVAYGVGFYYILYHRKHKLQTDYQNLEKRIARTARGEFEEDEVDLGTFHSLLDNIQNLQSDFKEALEQEVHSQKMKTELVSNVSHDLKTPLTSIISYIDLLKNKELSEKEREKYIDIIAVSSERLKHLIENLFEISKANSGNVTLNKMDVDLVSLLKQVEMECDGLLRKKKLTLRKHYADEKIIVSLDSKKTYRIFENLLSNVGKYAMDKTRVYIDIEDYNNMVEVSIRNISANELDFDPDEIMERFTRGDKSRNSEGSGLGLAIAKSFTELQNGTIKILVDGDLFKVVVRFYREES